MKRDEKKLRGVYEKKSGEWWIQYFDSDGHRRREKAGTKGNAIKLVELRRTQRLEGRKIPKPRTRLTTFKELATVTLEYSRANKRSYKSDEWRMQALVSQFGNDAAESITPGAISTWLDSQTWAVATRNRYLALLKLVYRLAEENGKISLNPARLVRQRKENNARIRYLRAEEETALRQVLDRDWPQHIPELEIALHTGMRLSEQYGMRWEDVNFDSGTITIPLAKAGDVRHVTLNSRATAILAILKRSSLGTGRVFATLGPRPWFEPAVRAAGLHDFTWHCLRHTFASRLVMAGVHLRAVQEAMGHQSMQMTCRYAHLAPGECAKAVEKLCQIAPSATPSATEAVEAKRKQYPTIN